MRKLCNQLLNNLETMVLCYHIFQSISGRVKCTDTLERTVIETTDKDGDANFENGKERSYRQKERR
jgi:hypothetical protein